MTPTFDAMLRSWPGDPWLAVGLLVPWIVYLRGWLLLRSADRRRWGPGRLAAFTAGLLAIYLALASPLEPFASLLLEAHMAQHLLLMMVAPPLVWLGAPLFPLVRGAPAQCARVWIAPTCACAGLRQIFTWLTRPWVAWPIYVGVTWFWHMPPAYELALARNGWHIVEHGSFLLSALVFWYPVVRPYPSRPRWSRWLLLPYLLLADIQNTVLAAWLTFSGRVVYPHYAAAPRVAGISALEDQSLAGVLMWAPGSIVFLGPLAWIAVGLLYVPKRRDVGVAGSPSSCFAPAPDAGSFAPLPIVDLRGSRDMSPGPRVLCDPLRARWVNRVCAGELVSAELANRAGVSSGGGDRRWSSRPARRRR